MIFFFTCQNIIITTMMGIEQFSFFTSFENFSTIIIGLEIFSFRSLEKVTHRCHVVILTSCYYAILNYADIVKTSPNPSLGLSYHLSPSLLISFTWSSHLSFLTNAFLSSKLYFNDTNSLHTSYTIIQMASNLCMSCICKHAQP